MKRFNAFTLVTVASLLFAITVMSGGVAGAATLNVVGGQLMGASGVLVDGNLYDVQFGGGTCIDLYNGCDDVSDFTFQTQASAILASQALLDQVFLDVPAGNFDSSPNLTSGCTDSFVCLVYTPFRSLVPEPEGTLIISADNWDPLNFSFDLVSVGVTLGYPATVDLGLHGEYTYAVWAPIPEPTTALLLGIGLSALAVRREKR